MRTRETQQERRYESSTAPIRETPTKNSISRWINKCTKDRPFLQWNATNDVNTLVVIQSRQNVLLMRRFPRDGALGGVVSQSMGSKILHYAYHSTVAAYPGVRRMYDWPRREYFWPNMSTAAFNIVRKYRHRTRMGTEFKQSRQLQLFPSGGPLQFTAVHITGPLPQIKWRNVFVVTVTNGYSKRT